MEHNLLALFQLCDSNFPTGAFSHSYGLESYIQDERVHDQESFASWLDAFVNEQLVYSDGIACNLVYEALERQDYEKIWKLDRMLVMQNLPRETREGTKRMGERTLGLVKTLYDLPVLSQYKKRIKENQSFGHPAIVFAMVGHHLNVPKSTTILYYLYANVSNLVQNAVRAIPLGQTAGQQTVKDFHQVLIKATDKIQQLEEEDFGVVSPGLELSQMNHERVKVRIFMS